MTPPDTGAGPGGSGRTEGAPGSDIFPPAKTFGGPENDLRPGPDAVRPATSWYSQAGQETPRDVMHFWGGVSTTKGKSR